VCDSKGFLFKSCRGLNSVFRLEKNERVTYGESWFLGTRKPPVLVSLGVLGFHPDIDGSGRAAFPQQTGLIGAPL